MLHTADFWYGLTAVLLTEAFAVGGRALLRSRLRQEATPPETEARTAAEKPRDTETE